MADSLDAYPRAKATHPPKPPPPGVPIQKSIPKPRPPAVPVMKGFTVGPPPPRGIPVGGPEGKRPPVATPVPPEPEPAEASGPVFSIFEAGPGETPPAGGAVVPEAGKDQGDVGSQPWEVAKETLFPKVPTVTPEMQTKIAQEMADNLAAEQAELLAKGKGKGPPPQSEVAGGRESAGDPGSGIEAGPMALGESVGAGGRESAGGPDPGGRESASGQPTPEPEEAPLGRSVGAGGRESAGSPGTGGRESASSQPTDVPEEAAEGAPRWRRRAQPK